nr:ribonuclease H-like domain-containing protein [Tanacetum cinerariifolium]
MLWHGRLDHLGKFDAKGDEGYFVGYSLSSKAFRLFNKRTNKVEENLHVDFLENKLIEKGAGPNWLFDIVTLTNSMNYVSVVVAGTSSTNISSVPKSSGISNPTATSKVPSADQLEPAVSLIVESDILTFSLPVPTICLDNSPESSSGLRLISKRVFSQEDAPSLGNVLTLSNRFEDTFEDTTNAVTLNGVEVDLSNMETRIPEEPKKIFDALKDLSWLEVMQEELLQFKIQNVWVLVDCPKGYTIWMLKVPFYMALLMKRSANTPMDKENPWGKDRLGKDVKLHLYKSMIGSLMYLTASRPDIMFA